MISEQNSLILSKQDKWVVKDERKETGNRNYEGDEKLEQEMF